MENLKTPSQSEIEAWLQEAVAKALEKPVASIARDIPLSEMGVDSVEAVALTGDLEDWSGLEVDPTLIFDYPTIAALAAHLTAV
jgi:acyl carrier protein